ncbi:hypothetical protein HDU91_001825, partial [Kappamyces sp. JEL0680]
MSISIFDNYSPFTRTELALHWIDFFVCVIGSACLLFVMIAQTRLPLSTGGWLWVLTAGIIIISVCLGDFLFLFLGVAMYPFQFWHGGWVAAEECIVNAFIINTTACAGLFSLAFLAFERYVQICRQTRITERQALLSVLFIWTVSVTTTLCIPLSSTAVTDIQLTAPKLDCEYAYYNYRTSGVARFGLGFCIAVIVFSQSTVNYCYYSIFTQYQNSKKKNSVKMTDQDIKVLKKCFSVTITFFVLWTPV